MYHKTSIRQFWEDCCQKPPIILQDLRMNYSMYKL